jgi:class 3 adenylate cyclase
MALSDDLKKSVDDFFSGQYEVSNGTAIPYVNDIEFGKKGRELELAMLFIDIRESTKIVDGFRRVTAAKMYKSFLHGVVKIARANDGDLCSFNGDGVLVAFIGETKRTNAAKAALQLSWFCSKVLKPKMEEYFKTNNQLADMKFRYGIGVDVGKVLVVRGGIKGENNNDLVWAGNATNYAVKLSSITSDEGYHIFISDEVYSRLNESSKLGGDPKRNMWEERLWKDMKIYRSGWTWKPT